MTSAAPLAGAAQDAAHTPEAGIGQTAAASQPITTTGILTGVVLPAVDLPLSATGVVTWNMSAPDAAVSLPSPLLTMSADPFQIVPGGVITYSVAITNVAGASLARVALDSRLPAGLEYVAQSGVGFSYSPRDQRLSWAIERIEPGRGLRGSFQLRATGLGRTHDPEPAHAGRAGSTVPGRRPDHRARAPAQGCGGGAVLFRGRTEHL